MNMMSRTSITSHISLLHASMVAHMQDPFSKFHDVIARTRRLLWSLPTVVPWVEFRTHYHDYVTTGALEWDGPSCSFRELGYYYYRVAEEGGVQVEGDHY